MIKAAKNLCSKMTNLAITIDIDKADRNKLQEPIECHGAARFAGIAAAGTVGLIGTAILGTRLLSPE